MREGPLVASDFVRHMRKRLSIALDLVRFAASRDYWRDKDLTNAGLAPKNAYAMTLRGEACLYSPKTSLRPATKAE